MGWEEKWRVWRDLFKALEGKTKSSIEVTEYEIVVKPSEEVLEAHGGYERWARPVRWVFDFLEEEPCYTGQEYDKLKGTFTTLEKYCGDEGYPKFSEIIEETFDLLKREAMGEFRRRSPEHE
jgi:hypothetical protein